MSVNDQIRMMFELNQMDECAESLKRVAQSMDNIQHELGKVLTLDEQTAWSGDAKMEYMQSIGDTVALLHNTQLAFDREYRDLSAAVAVYRQKEGLIQETLQKLATKNIFE